MNAFSPALFAASSSCRPCCSTPTECACAYEFYDFENPPGPGGDPNPFATVADAQTYIDNFVGGCFAVAADISGLTTIGAASFDGTTVDITATGTRVPTDRPYMIVITSVTIAPSDTLTITTVSTTCPDGDSGTGFVDLISASDCEGNALTPSGSGSGYVEYTGPSTGIIVVVLAYLGYESATSITGNFTITSSGAITVNPAVALWDDSGTTRQLEACPKMILPPLTESTGDWYADETAAQDVLDTATVVSNCVGYNEFAPTDSFTATDGGTSLSFSIVTPEPQPGVTPIYGSVNAEVGETITVTSSGGQYVGFDIYDYTGTLVESIPATSNTTEVSSALPYTGRYTIVITLNDPGTSPTTWTAAITSSGTMSVNTIQALYDVGLDCPARLDC